VAEVVIAIGSAVASAAGTVAAAAAAIATAVATAVATVASAVAAIASAIADVAATIASATWQVVSTLGQGVLSPLTNAAQAAAQTIIDTTQGIASGLWQGIQNIGAAINNVTAPILQPIQNGLNQIYIDLQWYDAWLKVNLAPLWDAVAWFDKLASMKMLYDLITGTVDISKLLSAIAQAAGMKTAIAIATLTGQIISLGAHMIQKVDDLATAVSDRIDNAQELLKTNFQKMITQLDVHYTQQLAGIQDTLTGQSLDFQRTMTAITRKYESMPWFLSMLIRALS